MLDARWLRESSGSGRVAQHTVRGLADLDDPGFTVTLWGDPDHLADIPRWCSIHPSRSTGSEWKGQRDLLNIPRHHGSLYLHQVRPLRWRSSATLIHDTIQLHYGAPRRAFLRRFYLRSAVRNSELILTVSDHSRRTIIDELGCPPERIRRLQLPIDATLAERVRRRRTETGIGTDILYVGRIADHKNVDGLLGAFAASGLDGERQLRVFGPRRDQRPGLLSLGRQLGIRHLDIATDTTDDDLVDAYAAAALVVQPSFTEGWGLSTFEAIACGIPVVSSNGGALPEQVAYARSPFEQVDVRAVGALAKALVDAPFASSVATMNAHSVDAVANGPRRAQLAADIVDTLDQLRRL